MKMRFIITLLAASVFASYAQARDVWTKQQAQLWDAKQPWLVGANYLPANAINQLEMWQAETFDPVTIDREFGWAQSLGMNTMRVFLHNLLWEQDPGGFKSRIDQFLVIAAKHHIKPVFVLFDSCWDPDPRLGPQHPPIPGVHNSGWVQAPGRVVLADPAQYDKLRAYVEGVVGAFAEDSRILAWDVWNEPDNEGGGNYPKQAGKQKLVEALIGPAFQWARSRNPVQPLTSPVWQHDDWSPGAVSSMERVQLNESDVISFHDYSWPEKFEARVKQLIPYGRPIMATEYLSRGSGSTVDAILPIAKKYNVAAYDWGLVDGKMQTRFPWDSWYKPYIFLEPTIWFHDLLHADGTPYRAAEAEIIRRMASSPKGQIPVFPYTH